MSVKDRFQKRSRVAVPQRIKLLLQDDAGYRGVGRMRQFQRLDKLYRGIALPILFHAGIGVQLGLARRAIAHGANAATHAGRDLQDVERHLGLFQFIGSRQPAQSRADDDHFCLLRRLAETNRSAKKENDERTFHFTFAGLITLDKETWRV